MKKFILFITMIFIFLQSVQAKDITFVQATDTHFSKNSSELEKFINDVNSFENIDFVIFTGDNIDTSDEADLKAFLKEIKNLKVRPYVLIGNHDCFKNQGIDKDTYMKIVKKELGTYHSNKSCYTFQDNDIEFVVLDGAKQIIPGATGYFNKNVLTWLDNTLSKHKDKKVVIFEHFPILKSPSKSHELYNKQEYLEVLKKHDNVIAIISGHYHKNFEEMVGKTYNIVTPALKDGNYKIITIPEDDNIIFTQLRNINSD